MPVNISWELERISRSLQRHYANYYFWRTYDRKEIDFVEEFGGRLCGYEFKWGEKSSRAPQDWIETYTNASFETIHRTNFLEFVT